MAQVIVPSKPEALSSNSSTAKKKKDLMNLGGNLKARASSYEINQKLVLDFKEQ
jgi:hypothetical protein